MSFLPLGAGVEMRSPAKKFILNAAQQKAVEARNLGRRRKEIAEGTNVEQRVFDNPDLRGILLGRPELERTLPPIIRGGKEYTDPRDPLRQTGEIIPGFIKGDQERFREEFNMKKIADTVSVARNVHDQYEGYYDRNLYLGKSFVIENIQNNILDESLANAILENESDSREYAIEYALQGADEFMKLSSNPKIYKKVSKGIDVEIEDKRVSYLTHDAFEVEDSEVYEDEERENNGDGSYTLTRKLYKEYNVSDTSPYVILEETIESASFEYEYNSDGEQVEAEDEDFEDYSPDRNYYLRLKASANTTPATYRRLYGRAK
jgi:hypothetical protein